MRNLLLSRRVASDLDEEIRSHLDMLTDERVRTGVPPGDARRAARIELGGLEQVKERVHDASLGQWLQSVLGDCRYTLRQLRRNPAFAVAAVFTLALGIGSTTAIFSVVYGVLLQPLPYTAPDRLVAIFEVNSKGRPARLADPNFDDFRDQSRSFQAIAKYTAYVESISGASQPTRTMAGIVSPDLFTVFGVRPIRGRAFTAADGRRGAPPAALVSEGYWRQELGAARDLSQVHLKIGGKIFSVVGVLPGGFRFPADVDVWMPADLDGENPHRTSHNYSAVARLRDGVSVAQASREISAIARRIHETSSEQGEFLLQDGLVVPLQESMAGKARSSLLVLLAAVGFLLLVACANVANLLLAHASARGRELAVRTALGAGRGRLIRQFLTEAFILSLAGGALGVLGARWAVSGLVAAAPATLPRLDTVAISTPVLAFALLLCTAVAAGLGAFAAVRASCGDTRESLVEGGRGQAGSRGTQRVGRVIVAAQMAITLVLIVGSGLLARSLMRVLEVKPGFRVDDIIAMEISLPSSMDQDAKVRQGEFFSRLLEELARIPGVRGVGAASVLPLAEGGLPDGMFVVTTRGELPKNLDELLAMGRQTTRVGSADFCVATDGYFQVLGIPLIRGRMFDRRDGRDSPHVAVISESLARARWPDEDPIGRTIEFGNMDGDLRPLTIVGIVGDIHENGLDAPPRPTVYVNMVQRPRAEMTVALSTLSSDADTQTVATAARGVVRRIDPEVPAKFRTFAQIYTASLGSRRFNVVLIGFFGAAALLLATSGVCGVMAYAVGRRTREIGVRVALGAATTDVLTMILGEGLRMIGIGVAVGFAGALILTRALESMLFGVTATDPVIFGSATLLLVGTALLACYLPARRAARVDPTVALRYQ